MPFKAVDGVVGGSDECNIAFFDESADAQTFLTKDFSGEVPYFLGGFAVEHAFVTEIVLQFKMAPVVHGVADNLRKSFGEFLEFFPVGSAAGNVIFINAVGTHDAPFIMIARKPDLRDVFEMLVLKNFLGAYVTMIVDYGHFCRKIVIKCFCGFGG